MATNPPSNQPTATSGVVMVTQADIAKEARKETILWMVLSSGFGLIQLFMIWLNIFVGNSPISTTKDGTTSAIFSLDNLLRDGMFIFFALSLVASAIVDYHMDNAVLDTKIKRIVVFVVPFFIILIGSTVYAKLFIDKSGADNLFTLEIVTLICAYIYTFYTKFHTVCYKIANP